MWSLPLGYALSVILLNLVLYGWRLGRARAAVASGLVERLGLLRAAWSFAAECTALAAVVLLVPIGWLLPRCRFGSGARGALVLLPGSGVNRGALWMLRRRLRHDGWSPVCCLESPCLRADVARAARDLRSLVDDLCSHGGRSVTLVGHGLGGLVARYYVRRYHAPNVRRIVTLGTPHHGTDVARLLRPMVGVLAPGSLFLRRLNAADHVPEQFDVIAIHSTFDATILPPENGMYPRAFNVQLNDVGHFALLYSRKVYHLMAENLVAPPR